MSHEIRTPLNAIVGFSKMLIDAELPVESKKGFSSIIENSTQQLLNIVNDILTISSIETKQEELHLEEINVNELLSELLAVFEAQNSTNRFIFLENSQGIIIKNDRTKIYQIVSNLLTNAQKFTSNGTIQFGYQLKENDSCLFAATNKGLWIYDLKNKCFIEAKPEFYMSMSTGYDYRHYLILNIDGKIYNTSQIKI
jgi:signal transduction histidine kinase